ncbi:MAG: imidazole glycerol phosphate synthase subunit HisH [Sphaerochaetaceae bacterium]|jgi:glutamine amidotransferase
MVAIVKYNAGNIRSVLCALRRLDVDATVTDDPSALRSADHVIFPGVGEASTAMSYLRAAGLDTVLTDLTQPFLGICLGMQLMCAFSEEHDTPCLGMFDASVRRFPSGTGDKIPHMGWNTISGFDDPLFAGIARESYVYFVHSYYAPLCAGTIATCTYADTSFSCALRKDNFRGVQFHPEKSGPVGERILRNFLAIR